MCMHKYVKLLQSKLPYADPEKLARVIGSWDLDLDPQAFKAEMQAGVSADAKPRSKVRSDPLLSQSWAAFNSRPIQAT